MNKDSSTKIMTVIRGATTSEGDTEILIKDAVIELMNEFILRNKLTPEKILSITFTVTKDITSCFPASIARKYLGLDSVAFLDCQQMYVPNDVNFCIRLMALVIFEPEKEPNHPYLRGASKLRSDRC
tara:strand:- start:53 stop:433 length:381 start_codon:yes stop_codon:yes gene_type:complete